MSTAAVSPPDLTLPYAEHECGVVDWHLPGGAIPADGTPVAVVVHGGFWKEQYDREHTRAQARALSELGLAVATPEYRRVPAALWPTPGQDVRAALDAVPGMATELGFAPGPVTAVGHSAGGQLVLYLAATGAPLDHAVALAPVCDLGEAIRLHLGDGAARALLGDATPAEADPMTLLERRPAYPVTVVHGRQDESVPVTLSRGLVARHPWVRYVEVEADHMALIDPGSTAWPDVTALLWLRGDDR